MKFEKEFKEALLDLPIKEKDKLLLRLLKRDVPLANQLHFELVGTQTVEGHRSELETMVVKRAASMSNQRFSAGSLLMELRYLSGDITQQTKISKDKFGEVHLNLLMLREVLQLNSQQLQNLSGIKGHKLGIYIIARIFKLLVMIRAMHEDYLADFRSGLEDVGELITQNQYLMRLAIQNGLNINWVISGEIPEDIKQRHDLIRKQGFLR